MEDMPILHRCKHCGKFTYRRLYCEECSPVVAKIRNRERCQRFRDRHGNEKTIKWHKEHPEKIKEYHQKNTKKYLKERVEYNRKYRAEHHEWYQKQTEKNNKKRAEKRKTKGYCWKCGCEANKSSQLRLCTHCLFLRSNKNYNKKLVENHKLTLEELRMKFRHLIPEQLYEPWIDSFIDILRMKVRLGIIDETGQQKKWTIDHINNLFNKYQKEIHESQIQMEIINDNLL